MIKNQRDLLSSALDSYLSQVSNRTNDVMKVLSIATTIMLPLSVITGLYRTNFIKLPEADNSIDFWILVIITIMLSSGLFFNFKNVKNE